MSKRYEFHSKLSQEQIFVRLRVYAKPSGSSRSSEGLFQYGRHKKGFWVAYMGHMRGLNPFWAEVQEEEGGSLITGSFGSWAQNKVLYLLINGLMLLFGVYSHAPIDTFISGMLGLNLFFAVVWLICQVAYVDETLEFIQQHLLE